MPCGPPFAGQSPRGRDNLANGCGFQGPGLFLPGLLPIRAGAAPPKKVTQGRIALSLGSRRELPQDHRTLAAGGRGSAMAGLI
jgi:hypothetical protein